METRKLEKWLRRWSAPKSRGNSSGSLCTWSQCVPLYGDGGWCRKITLRCIAVIFVRNKVEKWKHKRYSCRCNGTDAKKGTTDTDVNEMFLHALKCVRYSSHAVFELKLMSECIQNKWRGYIFKRIIIVNVCVRAHQIGENVSPQSKHTIHLLPR